MIASIRLFFEKYPWALYVLICLFSFFIAVFYILFYIIQFILKFFIDKKWAEMIASLSVLIIVLWFAYRVITLGLYYPSPTYERDVDGSGCIGRTGSYVENC